MDGSGPQSHEPQSDQGHSDDFTVRVSRRTVRRVLVAGAVVLALAAGIAIGAGIAGSDDGDAASSVPPGKTAAQGNRSVGSTSTTATPSTSTLAPTTVTEAPAATTAPPATEAPAAGDGPAAAGGAAVQDPVVAPPQPTAAVTLSLSRACGGVALTTSVTVEWHGTLGQDYFLQVNQSNGVPLMHQGVSSDGTQTFVNVACGLLPVHAQFAVNTATGSVYASAVT